MEFKIEKMMWCRSLSKIRIVTALKPNSALLEEIIIKVINLASIN
jgi:hypothetical protein